MLKMGNGKMEMAESGGQGALSWPQPASSKLFRDHSAVFGIFPPLSSMCYLPLRPRHLEL